jgi:hypothetical protein
VRSAASQLWWTVCGYELRIVRFTRLGRLAIFKQDRRRLSSNSSDRGTWTGCIGSAQNFDDRTDRTSKPCNSGKCLPYRPVVHVNCLRTFDCSEYRANRIYNISARSLVRWTSPLCASYLLGLALGSLHFKSPFLRLNFQHRPRSAFLANE